MKIVNPSVKLVSCTPDPVRLIERMGRVCYQSQHRVLKCDRCEGVGCSACNYTGTDIESAIKFVEMIKKRGHESVIEHAYASFSVICDRGITHEAVRHRIASFSQESTRFCNYMKEQFGSEIAVIQPPFLYPELSEEDFIEAIEFAEKKYLKLLANGESPQIARAVLPTCLKAEIGVSANFREWRHFLRLRTSEAAHPQMREIAFMIREELLRIAPVCFNDL